MSTERDILIQHLNITFQDNEKAIAEKLFCAALLCSLDTKQVQDVLADYNRLKHILKL